MITANLSVLSSHVRFFSVLSFRFASLLFSPIFAVQLCLSSSPNDMRAFVHGPGRNREHEREGDTVFFSTCLLRNRLCNPCILCNPSNNKSRGKTE